MTGYPQWFYYPSRTRPPSWVFDFAEVVAECKSQIDSAVIDGLTSDKVLAKLQPGLTQLGYTVETGKRKDDQIFRPVLFGDEGHPRLTYRVDAVHDQLGVVVEVEAGRGARGNAVHRDLIRTSLIVDVQYLALGVMREYRHNLGNKRTTVHSYQDAKDQLDAIYASGRLHLPFEGVLLFGY